MTFEAEVSFSTRAPVSVRHEDSSNPVSCTFLDRKLCVERLPLPKMGEP
jgi:hypothetical protein